MFSFSSKQLIFIGLIAIIGIGFFLRAYHFTPWLHFELDQARDARVIDRALTGSAVDLPLLGPKAGGTFLRLAPGFYYLQYASALVFGGTPQGMAVIVMLCSVLAIFVFYLLIRRYFRVKLALYLMLLFAVSEFFVFYGRFAWNPNMLPLFVLIGFYALLRAVDQSEVQKTAWLWVAIFSLTLATHFHFLAFLALPIVAALFLVIRRPRVSWRAWSGAALIIVALYLPVMLNETATHFANTQEFFDAITKKSSKNDHSLAEKFIKDISEHSLSGMVIVTGFEKGTLPAFKVTDRLVWACPEKCDQGKWYGVVAALLFLGSLCILVYAWWREEDRHRSDFLLLCGLWFGVTFMLFLPLAYDMAPRFFLLSGPLFFILLGLVFVRIQLFFGGRRLGWQIVLMVVILLVVSNVYFIKQRFDELSRADTEAVDSAPDRVLKERIRVTLKQQNAIVDFLEGRYLATGYPVYMWSEPQHRRALKYLMERRGMTNAVLGFDGIYQEGIYSLILRAQSDLDDALKKYRAQYAVGETQNFGTLVVIELLPKPEAIIGKRQDFSKEKPSDSQAPPRYTWREFFERDAAMRDQEDEMSLDQSEEKAQDN